MELENQQPVMQKNFSQEEGNFLINAQVLLKEFDCTICFCPIEDCHVTRCGHVFCKDCISEAINRHHRCPFCQSELQQQDMFKNYHFINIKKQILEEKEKQEKLYLKNIFKFEQDQQFKEGPIEKIFTQHLQKMILIYHNKFKETEQKCNQENEKLKRQLEIQTQKLLQNNEDQIKEEVDLNQKIKDITANFQVQEQSLKDQQQLINNFYIQSLEKSLQKVIPDPDLLDVRISMHIPQKNSRLESLFIKPTSFIKDFQQNIEEFFLKKGDPITDMKLFQESGYIVIIPLMQAKTYNQLNEYKEASFDEFRQIFQTFNQDDQQQIHYSKINSIDLFVNMKIQQGSQMIVLGNIKTKQDQPSECMTYTFKKENPVVLDYFSCQECGINWICPGCKDSCHKGHKLQQYVKQHNATWACCYCASKTKNCKALNKYSK